MLFCYLVHILILMDERGSSCMCQYTKLLAGFTPSVYHQFCSLHFLSLCCILTAIGISSSLCICHIQTTVNYSTCTSQVQLRQTIPPYAQVILDIAVYHHGIVTGEVTWITDYLSQCLVLFPMKSLTDFFMDMEQFLWKKQCPAYVNRREM